MKINDDPIQDVSSFRLGLDNLVENKEINSEYQNNLHNCSNDLSLKGSIKEEREHAEFARMKKEELLNKKIEYQRFSRNDGAIKNKKSVSPITIIIVICFLIASSGAPLIEVIESIFEEKNSMVYIGQDYIEMENVKERKDTLFKDSKNNILINATTLSDDSIVLDIQNNNIYMFNNIKIQTIFYDINNKPIHISENNMDTFFENGRHVCNINDVPVNYERFDFLITQPYIIDMVNINKEDIVMNWYENSQKDFEIQITNNSAYQLDSIEVVAIYYKEGNIVNINTNNMYGIKSGESATDKIYNWNYEEYDMVELIINDAYIY